MTARFWVLLVAIIAMTVIGQNPVFAQGAVLPWGQSTDIVAWQVFVQVMAPSGNPLSTNVEFETWASDQDIYVRSLPQWPVVTSPKQLQVSALSSTHLRRGLRPFVLAPQECTQSF